MSIPKLHLPTEESSFIENPYLKMGEFREETPVFWDELNGLYFLLDMKMLELFNPQKRSEPHLTILMVLNRKWKTVVFH